MAAIRLYVGGLGERVTEADIRTTFCHLGSVQTVDIIRTKGRSFAYIDFLPSSDNSLPKLFSTYNGCSWKGGKLKLEKAKPHYIDRLKQEWAEEAQLKNNEDTNDTVDSIELKSTSDLEKIQFRLFFPKLRKVKALSLRGTGKHKYSFQRVQVPPLPRLFCDCPEHCDPIETPKSTMTRNSDIQTDTINDEEVNMMNSVMNRLLNKGASTKNDSIEPSREGHDHDSQDGGMNDEEINVMNSVMKKLYDRETEKAQRKNLHETLRKPAPTLELEDNVNEMDEEIDDDDDDDDDIKINVGSGKHVGYDSWETSLINKMAGSNEQKTSNATGNKLDTGNRKVKPLSKKRKSVSNESDDKDQASPVHRKRARLETHSNEVDEHRELKHTKESETEKPITGGMWSQKSSWKKLIGDAKSGSFQFSNLTHGDQSDEEIEGVRNVVNNESKPNIVTSDNEVEFESVGNLVCENKDEKSLPSKNSEGIQASQLGLDKVARGSSWLQKSSWTQLVGGGNSSSFSISQILPGDLLEKQQLNKPKDGNFDFYKSGGLVNKKGENAFGGVRGSRFGFGGKDKKKEARENEVKGVQLNEAPKGNEASKKSEMEKEKMSNSRTGVGMSESCLFMRSDDSLKEWKNAKASLTKKRNKQ